MPRPRLPWFKLWLGATRHTKISALTDRQFRVWVELMDAAAEQKHRGRFASYAAAAAIIRRKPSEVRKLAECGLIDDGISEICMHDWDDWQRWRPEDSQSNDTGITQESPANTTRTARESHHRDVDVEGEVEKEAAGLAASLGGSGGTKTASLPPDLKKLDAEIRNRHATPNGAIREEFIT